MFLFTKLWLTFEHRKSVLAPEARYLVLDRVFRYARKLFLYLGDNLEELLNLYPERLRIHHLAQLVKDGVVMRHHYLHVF